MKMNGSGCVFDFCGKVPQNIYNPDSFESPIEEAVYKNDVKKLQSLIEEGLIPNASLRIGQMTCIEYTALTGNVQTLKLLIQHSRNAQILTKYFALSDVVERAYMISKNKNEFFGPEGALAEANRYEAALFTAVEYDQPECIHVLLDILGAKEPNKHNFIVQDNQYESLSACELAETRGYTECYEILNNRQWHTPVTVGLTRQTNRSTSQSDRME